MSQSRENKIKISPNIRLVLFRMYQVSRKSVVSPGAEYHPLHSFQDDSTCGQHLRLEVPGLAQTAETDPAAGPDGDDGQGGVLQGDTQPGLGWELEGPTDEVSDDVCVTHHDLVAVLTLSRLSSVEILGR